MKIVPSQENLALVPQVIKIAHKFSDPCVKALTTFRTMDILQILFNLEGGENLAHFILQHNLKDYMEPKEILELIVRYISGARRQLGISSEKSMQMLFHFMVALPNPTGPDLQCRLPGLTRMLEIGMDMLAHPQDNPKIMELPSSPVATGSKQQQRVASPVATGSKQQQQRVASPVATGSKQQQQRVASPVATGSKQQQQRVASPVAKRVVAPWAMSVVNEPHYQTGFQKLALPRSQALHFSRGNMTTTETSKFYTSLGPVLGIIAMALALLLIFLRRKKTKRSDARILAHPVPLQQAVNMLHQMIIAPLDSDPVAPNFTGIHTSHVMGRAKSPRRTDNVPYCKYNDMDRDGQCAQVARSKTGYCAKHRLYAEDKGLVEPRKFYMHEITTKYVNGRKVGQGEIGPQIPDTAETPLGQGARGRAIRRELEKMAA